MWEYVIYAAALIPALPTYVFAKKFFDGRQNRMTANGSEALPVELGEGVDDMNPMIVGMTQAYEAIKIMKCLSLSAEDRHNLTVLQDKCVELYKTYNDTPESIRNIPEVQLEVETQLMHIISGIESVKAQGTEALLRDLRNGTAFLRIKFPQEGAPTLPAHPKNS